MTDDIPDKADIVIVIVSPGGEKANADRRAMMGLPGEIVRGLHYAMRALGASRATVVVPRNRTDLRRRLARETGGCPYFMEGQVRIAMEDGEDQGIEKIGDCPYFIGAAAVVEIARSVERALATGEGEAGVETAKASPIGRHYRWLIEQSGGTIHAPYRVMVDGRKQ